MGWTRTLIVSLMLTGTVTACSSAEPTENRTSNLAAPQPDFILAGRHYIWKQHVTYVPPVKETVVTGRPPADANGGNADALPTATELALALRSRVLMGDNEYILAEPDVAAAQKILDGVAVQATEGHPPDSRALAAALASQAPPLATALAVNGNLKQQAEYIIGADNRTQVGCARLSYPASAKGQYKDTSQTDWCSATSIGPHTVAIAAHCVYHNGWYPLYQFTPGADTNYNSGCTNTAPFGSFTPNYIVVPGAWHSNEFDYDYAVMGFDPYSNPGLGAGYMGTNNFTNKVPNVAFQHWPGDKNGQYWQQVGFVTCPNTSTNTRITNYFDMVGGASGGGLINTDTGQLFGIQSTENSWCAFWSCNYWNEASNWTSTVDAFFRQHNWP